MRLNDYLGNYAVTSYLYVYSLFGFAQSAGAYLPMNVLWCTHYSIIFGDYYITLNQTKLIYY